MPKARQLIRGKAGIWTEIFWVQSLRSYNSTYCYTVQRWQGFMRLTQKFRVPHTYSYAEDSLRYWFTGAQWVTYSLQSLEVVHIVKSHILIPYFIKRPSNNWAVIGYLGNCSLPLWKKCAGQVNRSTRTDSSSSNRSYLVGILGYILWVTSWYESAFMSLINPGRLKMSFLLLPHNCCEAKSKQYKLLVNEKVYLNKLY